MVNGTTPNNNQVLNHVVPPPPLRKSYTLSKYEVKKKSLN